MKRIIYTIVAAAAIITGGVAAAAPAMASPQPNANNTIYIDSQAAADALPGTVSKNIDVTAPASANVWLTYRHIAANVTVEGHVTLASDIVDGNVTVTGPSAFLALNNQASHIHGNLIVTGSNGEYAGSYVNRAFGNWTQYPGADLPSAQSQIDGGLIFTGNNATLYVGAPLHVNGKFVYTNNAPLHPGDFANLTSGLTVDGQQVIG